MVEDRMSETTYREIFAKCILLVYENTNYMTLKKSESPDWVDETNQIGLEVTLATNSKIQQVSKINLKDVQSSREKEIVSRLGESKVIGDRKIFLSHTFYGSTIENAFQNIIIDKSKKLIDVYRKFIKNELFVVISDPLTNANDVISMIKTLPIFEEMIPFNTMFFYIDACLIKYTAKEKTIVYCKKIDSHLIRTIIDGFAEQLINGDKFDFRWSFNNSLTHYSSINDAHKIAKNHSIYAMIYVFKKSIGRASTIWRGSYYQCIRIILLKH